ncbi:MAG: NBR1-Ig-like domain-containing protein [Leptolinea sp.]
MFGPAREQAAIFMPPTIAITSTPVPFITPVSALVYSAPKSDCSNTLAYIKDLTVADGSIFSPGEKIDKRWLIENQGTCNWDARYTLRLTGGQPMDASTEQSLVPALAGSQAMVRIIFFAPIEAGKYRSAWQAYSPDSKPFGDPFYIEIEVLPGTSPAT